MRVVVRFKQTNFPRNEDVLIERYVGADSTDFISSAIGCLFIKIRRNIVAVIAVFYPFVRETDFE